MMLIHAQTKIAALLMYHPDALEKIVALSPDFKKLRNPLLRKLMAGRTSIAMAAKIGGCTPQQFFEALHPLGFETDDQQVEEDISFKVKPLPGFMTALKEDAVNTMDVRPVLAGGEDPLKAIQQAVKDLPEGKVLKIINTFEPTPLIKLLEKQGFQSYVAVLQNNLVETYFYKQSAGSKVEMDATENPADDWQQLLKHYAGNVQEIDVRYLDMPQPMLSILAALETLPPGKALFVYHKKIPLFLLTELKDRQFDYRIKEIAEGEVNLLIFQNV